MGTGLFADLIRRRSQSVDDLRNEAVLERDVLSEATKDAEARQAAMMQELIQGIQGQQGGAMLPAQPMVPPLLQGLIALSGNLGSAQTGNPTYRDRAHGSLDQLEAERQGAIKANVGLSREDTRLKQQQLLSLSIEQYSGLAERATSLKKLDDAAKFTDTARKLTKELDALHELEANSAASEAAGQNAKDVANIRGEYDLKVAGINAGARAFGAKGSRMSEKEYRTWKNDVLKDGSKTSGDFKNLPSLRAQLAFGVHEGHTLESWLAELSTMRTKSLGGDKPIFPMTILRNAEGKVVGIESEDPSVERIIKSVVEANFSDEVTAPEAAAEEDGPADLNAPAAEPDNELDVAEADFADAKDRIAELTQQQADGVAVSPATWREARKALQEAAKRAASPSWLIKQHSKRLLGKIPTATDPKRKTPVN